VKMSSSQNPEKASRPLERLRSIGGHIASSKAPAPGSQDPSPVRQKYFKHELRYRINDCSF